MKQVIRIHLSSGDTIDLLPNFTVPQRAEKEHVVNDAMQNIAAKRAFALIDGKLNPISVRLVEMVTVP